jgi:hypothetical protein
MAKLSERSDKLSDLDLFAEPVQLKFNSRTTYKTNIGGCVSIGFYILAVFICAVFFRSLIVGYDVNSVSTTYDLIFTDEK